MPAIRCSRSARSDPTAGSGPALASRRSGAQRAANSTSLPRGDLAAAIYATIDDDVETIFGDSITAINEHPDGVCVSFAQAKSRDFDLVIGADGLHSNVRRLTFGPGQTSNTIWAAWSRRVSSRAIGPAMNWPT